jgi:hypothetical protein
MDIIVTVKDQISQWEEKYSSEDTWSNLDEAEKWFQSVLYNFNISLRRDEFPREMVSIREASLTELPRIPHNWVKINLVTKVEKNRISDTYRCTECRITGKRWGLGDIIRDPKWKAMKYEWCSPPTSSCLA